MKIKVGVIFGGCSVEHEVSVISALQAIDNIDKDLYDIVPIYISKDKIWYTGNYLLNIDNYKDIDVLIKSCKRVSLCKIDNNYSLIQINGLLNKIVNTIDIAFPIVHGQNVEDGTLVGYLETVGVPYVGSNVIGSALGQDKVIMKQVFKDSNIPIVDYVWFYDNDFIIEQDKYLKQIKTMGYPVVVKPANLGSSVGIKFAKDEISVIEAINDAITYDKKIIVEKAIDNLVEVNCSVVGNYYNQETSLIEEVMSSNDILTYKDKYVGDGKIKGNSKGMVNTSRIIPAPIGDKLTKEIENISKCVFKALNLSGVVRIDFLIDNKSKKVYVNEPNTIPGSLSFYLWEPKGKKYKELLDDLIKLGIKNYKEKSMKTMQFDTNILSNYKSGGCKGVKK